MLAQHIGCNRLIVQSDCLEVIDTIQDGGFSTVAGVTIFDECRIYGEDSTQLQLNIAKGRPIV